MSTFEWVGLVGFAVAWPTGWILYAVRPWRRRAAPQPVAEYRESESQHY